MWHWGRCHEHEGRREGATEGLTSPARTLQLPATPGLHGPRPHLVVRLALAVRLQKLVQQVVKLCRHEGAA